MNMVGWELKTLAPLKMRCWLWKLSLFFQKDNLWSKMMETKYGGWECLFGKEVQANVSTWWSNGWLACGGLNNTKWFDKMVGVEGREQGGFRF